MLAPAIEPTVARVQRRLRSSGYSSLRNLTVTQSQGQILLAGNVPSYYMKQLASVLATTAVKNMVIRNEVIVM